MFRAVCICERSIAKREGSNIAVSKEWSHISVVGRDLKREIMKNCFFLREEEQF